MTYHGDMGSKEEATIKNWTDLINKSVHTTDDMDIGDIEAVSRDIVVVKRGFVHIHYYYIPVANVEGWDGNVLWLKITESEVKGKYERNKVPDPTLYYVKDYPYYTTAYYTDLPIIPSKYNRPDYLITNPPTVDAPRLHRCSLCDESFESEDELSYHIKAVSH